MIDYKKKSELINSSLFNEYKKIRKSIQFFVRFGYDKDNSCDGITAYIDDFDGNEYVRLVKEKNLYDYYKAIELDKFYQDTHKKDWDECRKIYNAHINRVKRVKDKVTKILNSGSCIFVTLTFNPKTLNNTTEETRRRYAQRFFNLTEDYVGNIDFGKKYEREHYHGVVQAEKINHTDWQFGRINFERIRNNTDDTARISQYIAKLVNHAIKETTKQCRLLYPKRKTN